MRRVILASWLDTSLAMRLDETGLARRRARLWRKLTPALAACPMLAPFAGRPLEAYPIQEPASLRRDFSAWNSIGLSTEQVEAAAVETEQGGSGLVGSDVIAGFSTGTTGRRGLFVASAWERGRYIGQSLAKLMPAATLWRGARIALFLRADSRLYRDVTASGRIGFAHFPLALPAREKLAALRDFAADTVVAPGHVLAELAGLIEDGSPGLPMLRRVFDGAEPMGEAERRWIGAVLGVTPRPIYQATEGFLGAACRYGQLHLNDDSLTIELEPIPGTSARRPIVTDLHRRTQPMVRVRLDDVIEPLGRACVCGFAGRVIQPIAGRVSDMWRIAGATILPGAVARAMEDALGPRAAWLASAAASGIRLTLRDAGGSAASVAAVVRLLASFGVSLPVAVTIADHGWDGPKRRRIRWHD